MWLRLKSFLRRLGRIEKIFVAVLIAYIVGTQFPGNSLQPALAVALFVMTVLVVVRLVRTGIKSVIWRLRNRLLVTYLFIAVVPIVLILSLVAIGAWILAGQIASYLVTTALEQRASALIGPAQGLVETPSASLAGRIAWIGPYFRGQDPGLEILVRRKAAEWRYPKDAAITPPPAGWNDIGGLVVKDGALYLWAHAVRDGTEATLMAPLGREELAEIVPDFGDVSIPARPLGPRMGEQKGEFRVVVAGKEFRPEPPRSGQRERLPPPVNRLDSAVTYLSPVEVAIWEEPGRIENRPLFIRTRYSAVLGKVFGQKVEWGEGVTMAFAATVIFLGFAGAFLIVEIVSLVIGVNLTRTITSAVHNLDEGTQKVMEGDFKHRIVVRGNDQLAQLSLSFNRMTENLERLVEVAKEKERLQSELEIAREVQNQLFPKAVPEARSLHLRAFCQPARMVSGDYYDYMGLQDSKLALAIGDVAGKGISAALLMATVQSTMRTQLRAGRELAAAAGNGSTQTAYSTAALVSRLNQQLYTYTPPEKFATFYFGVYDDFTGLLTYTNAGHLPPVLIRKGVPVRLDVNGMVVGAFPSARYEESSVQLEPGDLLVCFTDGITEPENEYGEMFGEDRLIEVLLRNADRDTEEIIASVMESVRHWTGSPDLQDDMTMLLARRL